MTPLNPFARPLAVVLLALTGFLSAGPGLADSDERSTPVHGLTQEQVIDRFGEPEQRHDPVPATGKHPTPPITRWDYADFSVFFESDIALHRVEHGKFPPE